MALSRVVSEIFNVEKCRDLEIGSKVTQVHVIESCTIRQSVYGFLLVFYSRAFLRKFYYCTSEVPSPSIPLLCPPFPFPFPSLPSLCPFLPSPPLRSRLPLLRLGGLGSALAHQTVFGEFQAKNLATSSNDLHELLRN